ncbi:MAG: hypothetical protein ABI443_00880 [Chthoniobacterales bacterium]
MVRVIAITQFVFLAMGAFTLNVIVRSNVFPLSTPGAPRPLSVFLAYNGVWFLALPVAWVALATILESIYKGGFVVKAMNAIGIFIAAATLGIYSYAIFWN